MKIPQRNEKYRRTIELFEEKNWQQTGPEDISEDLEFSGSSLRQTNGKRVICLLLDVTACREQLRMLSFISIHWSY